MNEIHNCDIIRDMLPGYTDHILSDAGRAAVEKHLESCEYCRHIYEEMKEKLETELSPEENLALDGFRKLRRHSRRLKLAAGSAFMLLLFLSGSLFVSAFIIGRPAATIGVDTISCVYNSAAGSVTVNGHGDNLNISRIEWAPDSQDDNIINLLIYETEELPFLNPRHDFTATIPDMKGRELYLACPDYDRLKIYSWTNDHYEKVDQLTNEIYRRIPALDKKRDILYYSKGIDAVNGTEGLIFQLDYLLGEDASYWFWDDRLTTDGELEPADFEIWISLEEPYQIMIFDYRTGEWTEDYSIVEKRRPSR